MTKTLAPTALIPNPLWAYASTSYGWSMWFLSASDVNSLMSAEDVSVMNNWSPNTINTVTDLSKRTVNNSFVVAEDSGLYPNYRVPGFPVNYHIQEVSFDTTFSPTKNFRSSNSISGTIKIIEPYGVTFIESLIAAGYDPSTNSYVPYTQAPYMLQLEFFGYDDNGNLMSQNIAKQLKKRFPISIVQCKVQVTKAGAEYTVRFVGWGQQGQVHQYGTTPKAFNVTGGTVGEFFSDFEKQLNNHYINDQKNAQNAIYADQYKFKIDGAIKKSTIVNNLTLAQSNANSLTLDFSKKNIPIPANTEILAIIDRVIAQSGFLTQDQLHLGSQNGAATDSSPASQSDPVKVVKTQVSVQLQGVQNSKDSAAKAGVIDPVRNKFPFLITYAIGQYSSYKAESPWVGQLADSTPITIKQYNYLYTGKNIDVVDFKLDFDMAYYTAALGYTGAIAGSTPTQNSSVNTLLSGSDALKATIGTISLGYSAFKGAPNLTPAVTQFVAADMSKTLGGGISNDSNAQKGADVLASVYSSALGDMIKVDLTILGDPTFIKQDDWLYIQDPTNTNSDYNKWDSMSQADFFKQYGHIRTDVGDVVVTLNINTPLDIDLDAGEANGGNAGLMYPRPDSRPSLFSGQYRVLMVKNIFKSGVFTQVLTLVRYINSDLVKAYYNQGANNLTTTGSTNGANASTSTPASQQVILGPTWAGPKQR